MAIFSDLSCNFQIIDYSATHGQLLIRSLKNQQRNYNVDIIIKGVLNILLPVIFNGIEISLAEINENNSYLITDYGFKMSADYRIFSIMDAKNKTYYLNAMCFGVYHNKLDTLETSIGRYDTDSLGENILWYAD